MLKKSGHGLGLCVCLCVKRYIIIYYTDHEITYLSSRDEVLSSIFLLDVLRREGQEESSFTKQTKEQKVRKHLPLNEINRRLSRSGWLLLRNNFLPGFLFKFPAWNGKSFFSSRGFYLITLALGKSMGRGTKGRRVTPNRVVDGHCSPRLQSLKMRMHWRGENFWFGENWLFPKFDLKKDEQLVILWRDWEKHEKKWIFWYWFF